MSDTIVPVDPIFEQISFNVRRSQQRQELDDLATNIVFYKGRMANAYTDEMLATEATHAAQCLLDVAQRLLKHADAGRRST